MKGFTQLMTQADTNDSQSQTTQSRSLRPALIASRRLIAGYSTHLRHLLAGLTDESIPAVLVCPPRCDLESIAPPALEIIQHPAFQVPLTEYYNRKILLERLVKRRVNMLHCLCETKASFTRWLSRQMAVPYVLTVNSLQNRWPRLSVSPRRCATIIAPAKSIAESLAARRTKLAERIQQINVGTFTPRGVICFKDPDQIAGVVIASPLKDLADFENIFGALRHLAIDGHEFMIVLIGTGRAKRDVWKMLRSLGLLQMVTFIPQWQSPDVVLSAGDIFIRPIADKSFDPLLLEAMSLGAATAACVGGVDDLIIEGQTAVTFDPEDEMSIYNCLRNLFNKKDAARKIARQAHRNVKENHKVSDMITATLQTYQDAKEWFKSP